MSNLTTRTLDCGLTLIVETIPGVRSAGLTWLVPAGTATEPDDRLGLTAMWSELLLRGAGDLNSREQADAFDKLGVSRGAGASTFTMDIFATMLGSRISDALPLIVNMVRDPRMHPDAVEPTRDLCLQAIDSLEDDPQERVMLELRHRHAPNPINRSTYGTREGLAAITAEELRPEWDKRALPGGSILALAGHVDADAVAKQLDGLLKGWTGEAKEIQWSNATSTGYEHITDQTNQVHIGIAYDAPPENDMECWMERVVTGVLSGGMSGRLFTEVREKRSLCYSVYASYGADKQYVRGVAYAGTTPERAQETIEVLSAELHRIMTPEGKVTRDEFDRAVIGLKSKLVMSGESTGARAGAIARDQRKIGRPRSLDELAARIDQVTLEQVNVYLAKRSLGNVMVATIGPEKLRLPEA